MRSYNGRDAAHYDDVMTEPQIITGTMQVQLSDADIVDLAQALGVDIDAMIAADGGMKEASDGNQTVRHRS